MPGSSSSGTSRSKGPTVQSRLRKLGLLESRSKAKQLTFELYFPRPPYRGAQYRAARGKDGLFNFVGLVLGHGGATVQRLQKASGAKIEVRDSAGNLNGAHPSSHGDPTLHAWVAASSRQRLDKAVALLLEVLQPTNTRLRQVAVAPGGSAVLEPVVPSEWAEGDEAEASAAEELDGPASPTPAAGPPRPPPAANAWASNRLQLKARPDSRQMSPTSSLQRAHAAVAAAESNANSDAEEGEAEHVAPPTPGKLAPPPPPPPPPPPRPHPAAIPGLAAPLSPAAQSLPQSADLTHDVRPAAEAGVAATSALNQPQQQQQQQQMATVWAKGLHVTGPQETPSTPSTPPDRVLPLGGGAGAALSWSLWDQSSTGCSFYEQLQAAASDTLLPSPVRSMAEQPAVAPASVATPYSMPAPAVPVAAPFPGLAPHGLRLLSFAPLAHPMPLAPPSLDAEHEMQQLLAAVASMATQDC